MIPDTISEDLDQMTALVRADSAESIPEAAQEFEAVPIATEYTIRVIEGGEMKEAAYKLRAGKILPYEKQMPGIPSVKF